MQSVKFDPDAWVQAGPNNSVPCGKQVHVRLSGPGSVEVDTGKGYRLVGYGTEFKLTIPFGGRIRSPEQTISVYAGTDVAVVSEGAPFTNFDKRPGESSVEQMVRRALKEAQVEAALAREKRRRADYEANKKRVDAGLQEENPIPEEKEPPVAQPGEVFADDDPNRPDLNPQE